MAETRRTETPDDVPPRWVRRWGPTVALIGGCCLLLGIASGAVVWLGSSQWETLAHAQDTGTAQAERDRVQDAALAAVRDEALVKRTEAIQRVDDRLQSLGQASSAHGASLRYIEVMLADLRAQQGLRRIPPPPSPAPTPDPPSTGGDP